VYVNERDSKLILQALGQRIRELRAKSGYSQEAFADKCGVHRTFMGTIERGESNLSFTNIVKVSTALNITLSTLFSDIEGKALLPAKPADPTAKSKVKGRIAKSTTAILR
jgi:transcriptional regulator with XRE-family HTH domain